MSLCFDCHTREREKHIYSKQGNQQGQKGDFYGMDKEGGFLKKNLNIQKNLQNGPIEYGIERNCSLSKLFPSTPSPPTLVKPSAPLLKTGGETL